MVEIDFGHFERWRQSHDSFTEWWRLTSDTLNVWRQLGQFQQMVETDLRHFEHMWRQSLDSLTECRMVEMELRLRVDSLTEWWR